MCLKAYKNFPLQALALPPQAQMLPLVKSNVRKSGHGHSCDHVTDRIHIKSDINIAWVMSYQMNSKKMLQNLEVSRNNPIFAASERKF